MEKAQAALEMIVSVVFLVLIFLVVAILALEKSTESSELKTYLDAKRIGESVKDNVNMISQQGPGYYKYFSVPEQIHGGYSYNLSFGSTGLDVVWGEPAWSTKLLTPNVVVSSIDYGLTKSNRIMNRGGRIEISGHRPNLVPVCDTISTVSDGTIVNITFEVINDAHVDDVNTTRTYLVQTYGGTSYAMRFGDTPEIPAFGKVMVFVNDTD
ncbi:MAG: hypothetical protein NTU61_00145, partial [Candidatus Altiarchaeota archaeon]|nr:hypothetical protein [Candidatus Altiarchaeota archaeon]